MSYPLTYKARHTLSEVDLETRTAICSVDGKVRLNSRGVGARPACAVKQGERKKGKPRRRTDKLVKSRLRLSMESRLQKKTCERCGFTAEHVGQLDVDHKVRRTEGGTDDTINLWVLCANCHRLKTILEKNPGWDLVAFGG